MLKSILQIVLLTGGLSVGIAIPILHPGRMTANESAAISACRTYAGAQEIYILVDHDGDGVKEYARHLRGDYSLLEDRKGAGDLTLVSAAFARAEGLPYQVEPKAGYVFKVLRRQGSNAAGGVMDYVTPASHGKGNMTRGYALAACPAEYGITGRRTFLISREGVVFGRDLGRETAKRFAEMSAFNPDSSWTVVK